MPNKNSLEAVKKGHHEVAKLETIGIMQIYYCSKNGE